MKLWQMVKRLRSDLDDENNIKSFFSDLQLVDFIERAIAFVNEQLRIAKKYVFFVLRKNKSVYDLPDDYIEFTKVIDYRSDMTMTYDKYLRDKDIKDTFYSRSFLIDDTLNKIYFNFLPTSEDCIDYQCYHYYYDNNDIAYIYVGDNEYDFEYYYEPEIIEITDSDGVKNYYRVADTEDVYFLGFANVNVNTLVAVNENGEPSEFLAEINPSYDIYVNDSSYSIVNANAQVINVNVNLGLQNIVPIFTDYDTGVACKLFICDDINITGEKSVNNDYENYNISFVDYGMEYYYEPRGLYDIVKVSIHIDAGSVNVETTTNIVNVVNVGDAIFLNGYDYMTEIVSIAADGMSFIVADVLDNDYDIDANHFYLIKYSDRPMIPLDVNNLIIEAAMYFAYKRENNPNANAKLNDVLGLINDIKYRIVAEEVNKINTNKLNILR